MTDMTKVDALLEAVRDERKSHIEKWGIQTHPSYIGESARREYEKAMGRYKAMWDAQYAADTVTWDVVLLEEVFEALSEKDPEHRKAELIQVAAVALAEAESIDLRDNHLLGSASESRKCAGVGDCEMPWCGEVDECSLVSE